MIKIHKELKEYFNSPFTNKKDYISYLLCNAISPVFDIFGISMLLPILNTYVSGENTSKTTVYAILLGCVMLVKGGFELYANIVHCRLLYKKSQKLSTVLFDYMMREDLSSHTKRSPGQVLTIVRTDATEYILRFLNELKLIIDILMLGALSVILIKISGWVGVVLFAAMVIYMIFIYLMQSARMQIYGEKRRKMEIKLAAQITTSYGAYKEIKMDERSSTMLDKFRKSSSEYADIQATNEFGKALASVLMQNCIQALLYFGIAVIMVLEISFSDIFAMLVPLMALFLRIIPVSSDLVRGLYTLKYSQKSYEAVQESLEEYDKICRTDDEKEQLREKELTLKNDIRIRNLTFGYQEKRNIFDNLSLDIPMGKTIAVIGLSGAGKTTFLDLLLGLLKPSQGQIFYDDYDIVSGCDNNGKCKVNLGKNIGYIPQTVYLNGESVLNNVAFLVNEEDIDKERAIECLKYAHVWEDIQQFPDGIDSLIGENGVCISGGQRQRIALARALYKDFDMLVMDEATAALDMDTEKAVIDGIRQMKDERTLLLVTHHMSLANECEVVFRINNQSIERVR